MSWTDTGLLFTFCHWLFTRFTCKNYHENLDNFFETNVSVCSAFFPLLSKMLPACCPYVSITLRSMTSLVFNPRGYVWSTIYNKNSKQQLPWNIQIADRNCVVTCRVTVKNQNHFVLVRLNSGVVLFLNDMQILLWWVFIRILFPISTLMSKICKCCPVLFPCTST